MSESQLRFKRRVSMMTIRSLAQLPDAVLVNGSVQTPAGQMIRSLYAGVPASRNLPAGSVSLAFRTRLRKIPRASAQGRRTALGTGKRFLWGRGRSAATRRLGSPLRALRLPLCEGTVTLIEVLGRGPNQAVQCPPTMRPTRD